MLSSTQGGEFLEDTANPDSLVRNISVEDDLTEASRTIQAAEQSNIDMTETTTLANKANNLEHNRECFVVSDLLVLLSHFRQIDKVSCDGTLSKKEFSVCFEKLGVTGFLIDVMFDVFTWDEQFKVNHINIKDFLCCFTLLTSGQAEDKIRVIFNLHDTENSDSCSVENVLRIFRCCHQILSRLSRDSFSIQPDEFVNVMMEHVHAVASVDGLPVKSIGLNEFTEACRRERSFFNCLDSMRLDPDSEKEQQQQERRQSTTPLLSPSRISRYNNASLRGWRRIFSMLPLNRCRAITAGGSDDPGQSLTASSQQQQQQQQQQQKKNKRSLVTVPKNVSNNNREVVLDFLLGRDSWHIMLSFLLGLRKSIERLALQNIQLVPESFRKARVMQVCGHSPSRLSNQQPLVMRDYSPAVFLNLRRLYNINDQDYIGSLSPLPILGNLLLGNLSKLSTLISEGKSGSLLYFSEDRRYVIKTISRREHSTFLTALQAYYDYVRSNPHTLIIRYFGLFDLKLRNGRVVYFTVMGNVFETGLRVDRRFDIKGSTVGRTAMKNGVSSSYALASQCLKDNDLDFRFLLPTAVRRDLIVQVASDANWLASFGLMDYSLLIGIHHIDDDDNNNNNNNNNNSDNNNNNNSDNNNNNNNNSDNNSDNSDTQQDETIRLFRSRFQQEQGGIKCSLTKNNNTKCVIFVGIIDCFTQFDVRKCTERFVKVMAGVDREAVSVMPPTPYSRRFINFVCEEVFADDKSIGVVRDEQVAINPFSLDSVGLE